MKRPKWEPSEHASGRWRVTVPAKFSDTGRRRDRYFDTKRSAEQFISETLGERQEHGKQAVSSEERHWINVARTELGSLDRLREVLDHWSRTGKGVKPITAHDAAEEFIRDRESENLNPKTLDDIRWRLRRFGKTFGTEELHQITPGSIEAYLKTFPAGWSRKSHYKRLQPLFDFSKRQRWLIADPFDELRPPETGREPRTVYTPEDFGKLLQKAIEFDKDICRFIALSGLGFFRTRELVRRLDGEPVLEWSDILWDRKEIHVREEVGKHTRRSSNERFVPLHHSLGHVLTVSWPFALKPGPLDRRAGRVVDCSLTAFKRRIHKVFTEAGVDFIENGLRKSAISYWLAAHPEHGVGEVARYAGNSEASCRKHYLRILTKAQGEAWFDAAIVF
jgi:hypothetical protein